MVWNIFYLSIQLGIIIPTDELIFFRGVGIPPTSHIIIYNDYQWWSWSVHIERFMWDLFPWCMIIVIIIIHPRIYRYTILWIMWSTQPLIAWSSRYYVNWLKSHDVPFNPTQIPLKSHEIQWNPLFYPMKSHWIPLKSHEIQRNPMNSHWKNLSESKKNLPC